jgi:hypothetical protein
VTEYDAAPEPDVLGDHALTLIAATTAQIGVETVHGDFKTLRDALDADSLCTPTNFASGDDWSAWYTKLAPKQRRTIIEHALQMLEPQA